MGPVARLTFDEATEIRPHWTPDGEYVSFTSLRGDDVTGSLWKKRADGTGSAEPVFDGFDVNEGVWSPAGDWIVLMSDASGGNPQPIFALRPGIDSVAMPLLTEDGIRYNGPNVSRDGRWLAYSSDETGRSEVFVSPFPDVNAGKVAGLDVRRWPIALGAQRSGDILSDYICSGGGDSDRDQDVGHRVRNGADVQGGKQ